MRLLSNHSTISLLSVILVFCLNLSTIAQIEEPKQTVELIVLGIAQDAGFPQAACQKPCCKTSLERPSIRRHVASLDLSITRPDKSGYLTARPIFHNNYNYYTNFRRTTPSAPNRRSSTEFF